MLIFPFSSFRKIAKKGLRPAQAEVSRKFPYNTLGFLLLDLTLLQ